MPPLKIVPHLGAGEFRWVDQTVTDLLAGLPPLRTSWPKPHSLCVHTLSQRSPHVPSAAGADAIASTSRGISPRRRTGRLSTTAQSVWSLRPSRLSPNQGCLIDVLRLLCASGESALAWAAALSHVSRRRAAREGAAFGACDCRILASSVLRSPLDAATSCEDVGSTSPRSPCPSCEGRRRRA